MCSSGREDRNLNLHPWKWLRPAEYVLRAPNRNLQAQRSGLRTEAYAALRDGASHTHKPAGKAQSGRSSAEARDAEVCEKCVAAALHRYRLR